MAITAYQQNGKRFYTVYVNGFDRQGRRIQSRKKGIESITKAKEAEFELKRDLARRKELSVDVRWGEWLGECMSVLKVKYRPSTLHSYSSTIAKWIPEDWPKVELSSFTQTHIHELIYETLPPETTMHTRKYVLKIVKKLFQMAVDLGKIAKNPCHGMVVKVPEPDKKVLTNTEVETFLREARATNHRFYPIWVVALYTGMRSGELYALRWSDVHFERETIRVSRSWSSKNGYTTTKNQKSRIVPVSGELMGFLKRLKLESGGEEFVLPHLTEWTRGGAAKVIKAFCRSIGVTDIRFHDLRATFITNLLARGEPLVRVMATVGHSDMETTNVYLRQAGIELQGATERLGYRLPEEGVGRLIAFPQASVQS